MGVGKTKDEKKAGEKYSMLTSHKVPKRKKRRWGATGRQPPPSCPHHIRSTGDSKTTKSPMSAAATEEKKPECSLLTGLSRRASV